MADTKEDRNKWMNNLRGKIAVSRGEDFEEDKFVEMDEEVYNPDAKPRT